MLRKRICWTRWLSRVLVAAPLITGCKTTPEPSAASTVERRQCTNLDRLPDLARCLQSVTLAEADDPILALIQALPSGIVRCAAPEETPEDKATPASHGTPPNLAQCYWLGDHLTIGWSLGESMEVLASEGLRASRVYGRFTGPDWSWQESLINAYPEAGQGCLTCHHPVFQSASGSDQSIRYDVMKLSALLGTEGVPGELSSPPISEPYLAPSTGSQKEVLLEALAILAGSCKQERSCARIEATMEMVSSMKSAILAPDDGG